MGRHLTTISLLLLTSASVYADGVGRIVRIPTPASARCINAKTDEITMTLRYVKTQKNNGFLTNDNRAGVTVIATLNSDGNPKAQNPSVNLVSVQDAPAGQVYLPLEYSIASLMALSQDSGASFTKNILLELYMDKVRGRNSFGDVLDFAGTLLAKLPIPANPYTNAVSQVINYATTSITKATTDNGGQLFASIALQFNDRDQSDIDRCKADNFESTGAIAVVEATGAQGATLLPLDKLNSDYCWSFVATSTFEIQYAVKPSGGCGVVSASAFKDVPNDYVMMLLSANKILSSHYLQEMLKEGLKDGPGTLALRQRQKDLEEARKLCDAMKLNHVYCGAL